MYEIVETLLEFANFFRDIETLIRSRVSIALKLSYSNNSWIRGRMTLSPKYLSSSFW